MKKALIEALAEYGKVIKRGGWKRGEPVIRRHEKKLKDFRRWAHALGIMLRAEELLKSSEVKGPKE